MRSAPQARVVQLQRQENMKQDWDRKRLIVTAVVIVCLVIWALVSRVGNGEQEAASKGVDADATRREGASLVDEEGRSAPLIAWGEGMMARAVREFPGEALVVGVEACAVDSHQDVGDGSTLLGPGFRVLDLGVRLHEGSGPV